MASAMMAVVLLVACSVRRPGGIVGASHGDAADSASSVGRGADDGGGPGGPSPIPADFHAWAKQNPARFVSAGHATGRFVADVYGDDAGVHALASASPAVPAAVGARLVMEHVERVGPDQGKVQARMMMEKRPPGFDPPHGDWRYVVVNAAGSVAADGPIEACAGCHEDAPRDHLFPIVAADAGP